MLIHYQPWTREINLAGKQVGWENSVTGRYDPSHILEAMDQAINLNSLFVFDIGRSLYAGVGICRVFVEALRAYRGTVVLEHEDLGMAVASLGVLRGLS